MFSDTNPSKQSEIDKMYEYEYDTPLKERSRLGCLFVVLALIATWAAIIYAIVKSVC